MLAQAAAVGDLAAPGSARKAGVQALPLLTNAKYLYAGNSGPHRLARVTASFVRSLSVSLSPLPTSRQRQLTIAQPICRSLADSCVVAFSSCLLTGLPTIRFLREQDFAVCQCAGATTGVAPSSIVTPTGVGLGGAPEELAAQGDASRGGDQMVARVAAMRGRELADAVSQSPPPTAAPELSLSNSGEAAGSSLVVAPAPHRSRRRLSVELNSEHVAAVVARAAAAAAVSAEEAAMLELAEAAATQAAAAAVGSGGGKKAARRARRASVDGAFDSSSATKSVAAGMHIAIDLHIERSCPTLAYSASHPFHLIWPGVSATFHPRISCATIIISN